jgi:hypothetical protein
MSVMGLFKVVSVVAQKQVAQVVQAMMQFSGG